MRILLLLLFFSISHAQILIESGITHGAEIEFTSDWIYAADRPDKIGQLRGREYPSAKALAKIIQTKCRALGCYVENTGGKWGPEFRVVMKGGWWFQISYDPLCVEIQTKPSTLQELYRMQPVLEGLIFESAQEAGMKTTSNRASHMNTGARSAFGYDVRSLFNYFVDNANHPELSTGILRNNWDTSPPLIASHENAEPIILSIQERIENKTIKSFAQLAVVIEKELHSTVINPRYHPERNQDLTFRKLKTLRGIETQMQNLLFSLFPEEDMPIERRAVRAVRSFHEMILHAEITESRIAWVKQHGGFVRFKNRTPDELFEVSPEEYFKNWLQQTKLAPDRYLGLINVSTPVTAPNYRKNSCQMFYAVKN